MSKYREISPFKSAPNASLLPSKKQVAALCWRKGPKGKEVLLITSRDSGRWIIPKGWPMKRKENYEAAAQEAWEEAGVKPAKLKKKKIGSYKYVKELKKGGYAHVSAKVFPLKVKRLEKVFPEMKERKRMWISPKEAAKLVREPELRALLRKF